jgi:ferric-dicitrate binding protein FerR (iron transport regulator)
MTDACARWTALADREALDELLSDAERSFKEQHASTCRACGAEAAFFMVLSDWTRSDAVSVSDGAVERVLESLRSNVESARPKPAPIEESTRPTRPTRPARPLGSSARSRLLAGLAAVAAFGLLLSFFSSSKPSHPAPIAATRRALLTFSSGPSGAAGHAIGELSRGAVVRTSSGSACLRLEPGVSACLGENSELSVTETALEKRRLDLARGRVVAWLEKQPPGAEFSIATKEGRATVTGTTFSVEIANGVTLVRVAEGTVVTQYGAQSPRPVSAGQRLILGEANARAMSLAEAERDRSLARRGSLWSGGDAATLEIPRGAADAWIRLDGVSLGPAPLALLVAPGQHRFEVGVAERVVATNAIRVEPGKHILEVGAILRALPPSERASDGTNGTAAPMAATTGEPVLPLPSTTSVPFVAPPAGGPSSAAFPDPTPDARSAAELLRAARALRAEGRLSETARAYALLEKGHPTSAEAIASYVSLGDVRLAMGDAAGALDAFDAYLGIGGPLAQEARYGRIRALAGLGRAEDAARATDEFLRLYPDSVQARSLRKPR